MPEHYPIVGTCLLKAIKKVLGDAATPEIMDAWAAAYFFLADIFIDAENKIREVRPTWVHKKDGSHWDH